MAGDVESSDEREQRCGGSCWWQMMLRVEMNVSSAVAVELVQGDGL